MITLQAIFGDDEHTATIGPYQRVLRTRKWLFLTSGLGVIVANGFYHPEAVLSLVKVIELPTWLVNHGLVAGLTYMLIQYAMLCRQLAAYYSTEMENRMRRVESTDETSAQARQLKAKELEEKVTAARLAGQVAMVSPQVDEAVADLLHLAGQIRSLAETELLALKRVDWTQKPGFRWPEWGVDLIRVVTPAAFAIFSLGLLVRQAFALVPPVV